MTSKRVSVRLVAEGGKLVKAELEGVGEAGEKSFRRIERQADVTGAVVSRVMGVLGAAISVRQLATYADTWTDLRSRVDLATGSQEAGAAVMERLADMARRTYSSLGQTTESWLANATALRELGMSTRESLDFTEALNNAMVVSGARAERAASVQNALSKAMALGKLSGDNLNTVIQTGGRVAELLAAELGVNVNQLRDLGAQGAITGAVIRNALVGNLERLREEADSMPATIGDAFTLMGNAALRLVGTWDQMSGASSTVASAIILVADNIERLASIGVTFAAFMAGRWVAAFIAARVATLSLSGALAVLRGALIRTGIGALIVAAGELVYWFGELVKGAGGFGNAMELLGNLAGAVWEAIKAGAQAIPPALGAVWAGVRADFYVLVQSLMTAWSNFLFALRASTPESVAAFVGLDEAIESSARAASGMGDRFIAAQGEAAALAATASGVVKPAFQGVRDAAAALGAAVSGAAAEGEGALGQAAAGAAAWEEALEGAGGAAKRAGGAARAAGAAAREASEKGAKAAAEDATGWAAAAETLADYAAQTRDAAAHVGDAAVAAFRGAEDAVADFITTGKLGVREMATSIIADLARIATRRFILGPLSNALSTALGGLGGGVLANVLHAGGVAGAAGPVRAVPALAFAGARRMHSGGWAGLRPDEVPTILQRGERVLNRRETQAYDRGVGGPTVINISARDVASFRQSRTQIAADISRAVALGRRGI